MLTATKRLWLPYEYRAFCLSSESDQF